MAIRNLLHLGSHIIRRLDSVIRTKLLRKRQLLIRTRRRNNLGANRMQHLHKQRAAASSSRMHKRPLARLDIGSLADKRPRRQALEIAGGSHLGGDAVGDRDDIAGIDGSVLGIRAALHVDGLGADGELGGRGARGGNDFAGGFAAQAQRELRRLVQAAAEVCIDEVDAGKLVADEDLVVGECGHGDVLVLEDFDAAVFGDLDGLHGSGEGSHCGGSKLASISGGLVVEDWASCWSWAGDEGRSSDDAG